MSDFIINCCWCCYRMCCWWIDAMNFHNYGLVMWIGLLLKVLVKLCWIVQLCWNDVLISSFVQLWVSFWVHIPINNLWKLFKMLGDQNLGFWVKNVETRNIFYRTDDSSLKRTPSEMSPMATSRISLKRTCLRLSELCPVFGTFFLRSGRLRDVPGFQKCFFQHV